jgi:hypothetical protein
MGPNGKTLAALNSNNVRKMLRRTSVVYGLRKIL